MNLIEVGVVLIMQELGKEAEELDGDQTRIMVEMLRQMKKMIKGSPAITLGENTKVLRQACFMENFKRSRARTRREPSRENTEGEPTPPHRLRCEIRTKRHQMPVRDRRGKEFICAVVVEMML
jgi:hypothetical protein